MSRAKYTFKLDADLAGDIHWGAPGAVEVEGVVFTQEHWGIWAQRRWDTTYKFVIKRQGPDGGVTYWQAFIDRGSTENQDNCDFRDNDLIEFEQVDRVPTVTYDYMTVR